MAMEESLKNSNGTIDRSSQTILRELQNMTTQPLTASKAELWLPKAQKIVTLSKECYSYIANLKKQKTISEEETVKLFNVLNKYEADILNIDVYIKEAFNDPAYAFWGTDSIFKKDIFSFKKLFSNTSTLFISAFLTKLQTNIKLFENRTISVCNTKFAIDYPYFGMYSTIIAQNYEVLKQGSELEIISGIGLFSKAALPEIIINGKIIPVNEMGYSSYKKTISNNPGNYSIPVKINFTDENGEKQTAEKVIEYTVVKECDQ